MTERRKRSTTQKGGSSRSAATPVSPTQTTSGAKKHTSKSGGSGRKPKSSQDSRARAQKVLNQLSNIGISAEQVRIRQREFLSAVAQLLSEGKTNHEMRDELVGMFSDLPNVEKLLTNENLWDLVRLATIDNLFVHRPTPEIELANRLIGRYPWLDQDHVSVVDTRSPDTLALHAAEKLLSLIRNVHDHRRLQTVHVGFAGGSGLRRVAWQLSQLLKTAHPSNPSTIVFHAMVASFDEDDLLADPSRFSNYFEDCAVTVRVVRMPVPGLIERRAYDVLREQFAVVEDTFTRIGDLQIIVTSGSQWSDRTSMLEVYLKAAEQLAERMKQHGRQVKHCSDTVRREVEEKQIVGDMLWQPVNANGPVALSSFFRIPTLMPLDQLPDFIAEGNDVLLVMGRSTLSQIPRTAILETILSLHPHLKLITHLVSDSPTVEGIFYPEILRHWSGTSHQLDG